MSHRTGRSNGAAFAAVVVAMLVGYATYAANARAATFTATDTASLATAIQDANSTVGANTIVIDAGQYSPKATADLTNTTGPLTIQGPAPTPNVNGAQAKIVGTAILPPGDPVFSISSGVTVSFDDIVITTAGTAGEPTIDDFGNATLNQVTIAGASGPALTIEPSSGGATPSATLLNSTIAYNLDIGIVDDGIAMLTNTTVTENAHGGIDNALGTLNLVNTIVADNSTSADCTAAATTSDHSLDSDGSCGVGALSGLNPKLGSVGLNGGTTSTDVPESGSPAIGAGNGSCPAVDQRGASRPATGCDIGAVQTDTVAPVFATTNVTARTANPAGTAVTFSPTWTDAGAPTPTSSCTPASGSTFPIGVTTVSCSTTDALSNKGVGTFTVTVDQVSSTPPTISFAVNNPVAATSASGAIVSYTATATDSNDGTDPVQCAPASGTQFALGDTTVSCTSTDSVGNTATQSYTVIVTDQTPPVIKVPNNFRVPAGGASGATVTYTATASDLVDGTDPTSCTPASGATFPIGTTTVNCTSSDMAGNTATASFTVTVFDIPTVDVSDQTVTATSSHGAVVTYMASATDPVDGSDQVTCAPASGSTFQIGATTVSCSATNAAGQTGTASFTVTVQDAAPVISAPADVTAAATSAGGAAVSYSATAATDFADGTDPTTCAPASGSTFAIGTTTVTCTATNKAGIAATPQTFTVTVTDVAPVITAPGNVEAAATSGAGAAVSYSAPAATDFADGSDPTTCAPASGSTFAIGTTTVTCAATNKAGISATPVTFTVTVGDAAPVITPPGNVTTAATGANGATVSYTAPAATDFVDGTDPTSCTPASGSTFAIGTTTVTCNAANKAGIAATPRTFTVTVTDKTAPVIDVPSPVTVAATSATGAVVTYSVTASDVVDGSLTPNCTPATGASFAVGSTSVTCTATDKAGNSATASFGVTVTPFGASGVKGFTAGVAKIASVRIVRATATVVVSCGGAASATRCAVQLELTLPGTKGKKATILAQKSATVSAGKKATVALRLSASGVKAVKRHHDVQLKETESGGTPVTRAVVFKNP